MSTTSSIPSPNGSYRPAVYPPVPPPVVPNRAPMTGWRIADIIATIVATVVFGVLAALAAYVTVFFVMMGGSCHSGADCSTDLIGWAYLVSWGGAAVASLVVTVGVVVGAVRRKVMVVWPLAGTVIVIATFAAGYLMAAQSIPS
ncbi:hypothetical protein [Gordonia araii]|nr:hypothetical protein [Gordonia araii]NNG96266.1 hypothetical protein [Gordonia araii NBRC 100433]